MTTLNRTGVVDALMSFHASYYTTARMKLVVVGRESLDDLADMVVRCASACPCDH
jgi:secreted Zn-dependent insulinase-like peptidase